MTLETLARIGEFAGAIAVIVTLVYVAIQVRHNHREVRAQTAWRITESINQFTSAITSDGETAEIWCRGNDDFEALDRVERERYVVLVAQWVNVLTALHRTRDTSPIPAEYWDHNVGTFAIYYSQYPGFKKAAEFVNMPESVMREVERRSSAAPARPVIASPPATQPPEAT